MQKLPTDLIEEVSKLDIENPSDKKLADTIIRDNSNNATQAMISWLAALVERKGVKFDVSKHDKQNNPTTWPLTINE